MGRKKHSEKFIIKVQISLNPPDGSVCLIYNEDKSVHDQMPTPRELPLLLRGRKKGYFWATRTPDGVVTIVNGARDQEW